MCVYHLVRAMFLNDAGGPLAEQLSGIDSFVSRGNSLSFPQVQRTASQVQRRDVSTADVSVIILAARQVAWSTQWPEDKNSSKYKCVMLGTVHQRLCSY